MVRFVVFLVLTVVLVVYIGAHFMGAFSFIGAKDYTVALPMRDASGLFERSEVTFRGSKVGTVKALHLSRDGVVADLTIEGGGPPIPADLNVVVADRSAVGEKYVDLLPNVDTGPFLKDGDTVPADRVTTPVPVEDVLKNLDSLVASVPLNDLRTVVNELGKGFDQLGPKLQLLLNSTNSLVRSAQDTLPETLKLIHDARTVLQTQNDLSDPIKSFSKNVNLIAGQLKESDPDIRRLTRTGPEAGRQISALLDESGDGLSETIRQSLILSRILKDHLRGIQSVLQLYPGLAAAIPTILPGDGTAHLGLVINIDDPPNCTAGYEATVRRSGVDITPPNPLNYRAYCREPIYSPTDVRGIKPQYPFKNNQPQPPPEWYNAFYTDGPAAGIFGPPNAANGHHGQYGHGADLMSTQTPDLPGLLGAPSSFGSFGLTPSVLSSH
jgi:phospholipid/cholesterol/gamma-HCH transport system substrate-binding protein